MISPDLTYRVALERIDDLRRESQSVALGQARAR